MVIKESYSPEVGPFYVIDNVVFVDTEEVRDLEVGPGGFKDSDNTHYDYWSVLRRLYPELRNVDYDYYPRGRVVYSSKEDKYYVYLDKCLKNMKNINSILSELKLPTRKVEISDDEHYQCHNCNENYANISENIEPPLSSKEV